MSEIINFKHINTHIEKGRRHLATGTKASGSLATSSTWTLILLSPETVRVIKDIPEKPSALFFSSCAVPIKRAQVSVSRQEKH